MKASLPLRNIALLILGSIILSGCLGYYDRHPHPRSGPHPKHSPHIPEGHMPPPGKCRIWFPDRPPGHQPPPGNCYELEHQVPPEAILAHG